MNDLFRFWSPMFAIALLYCALGTTDSLDAQAKGSISGRALDQATGRGIAYATVHLSAEPSETPSQSTLTQEDGSFRFASLVPGAYRLRLSRIGLEPSPSEVLTLKSGVQVSYDLVAQFRPIQLEQVNVGGDRGCFTAEQLRKREDLLSLWREAQKGAEARRLFSEQYQYTFDQHHTGTTQIRGGRRRSFTRDSVVMSDPGSVVVRRARHMAEREARGFGRERRTEFEISVPDEQELLEDSFLVAYCLEENVEVRGGSRLLRFRPVTDQRDRMVIHGTLWVDSATYAVQKLEVEFARGGRRLGTSSIQYQDIPAPGGMVRMPTHIQVNARPDGMMGLRIVSVENSIVRTGYRDFKHTTRTDRGPT